jgi:hypothetical protein
MGFPLFCSRLAGLVPVLLLVGIGAAPAQALVSIEGTGEPAFTNTTTNTVWVRYAGDRVRRTDRPHHAASARQGSAFRSGHLSPIDGAVARGYRALEAALTTGPCHSAIRANGNRIVARETPTHDYATIATWSGAD